MNIIKSYRLTILGGAIAIILFVISVVVELDFFEWTQNALTKFELYEMDEFFCAFIVFLLFLLYELRQKQKKNRIELEKLKIYRAMMNSTHHVLNNFLNQMLLFKLTADETKDFPKDVMALYDDIIDDAKRQIRAMGSIDKLEESDILKAVNIRTMK